jgi:translation initiation factor IF-2
LAEGVQLEAMGGDVPSVEISALTGEGLDQLVETITAVAEMQDLRADSSSQAYGRIIESKLQKGLG